MQCVRPAGPAWAVPPARPRELYRLRASPLYRIRWMRTYIRTGLLTATYLCQVAAAVGATAPLSHVSVLTGDQVVQILDNTVDWYRTLGAQQQTATQPSDLLILYANQQTADKVIGLAFEIARANAELLSSEASSVDAAADTASSPQSLSQQQKRLEEQRK